RIRAERHSPIHHRCYRWQGTNLFYIGYRSWFCGLDWKSGLMGSECSLDASGISEARACVPLTLTNSLSFLLGRFADYLSHHAQRLPGTQMAAHHCGVKTERGTT